MAKMTIRIEPVAEPARDIKTKSVICRPRVDNIPVGKPRWEKVSCPVCGDPCWKLPEEGDLLQYENIIGGVCTTCALKMG